MKYINRWWAVPASVLLVAAWSVALAEAQQAPGSRPPCAPRQGLLTADDREAMGRIFMNRVKEKVGLSDQQAQDIRNTLRVMRNDARADLQALCQARLGLRTLMEQQNSDPAALKAAGDQIKALQAKLMDRRLDTYLALRSKLTAEQWSKWVELRKERRGPWRGRPRGLAS